MSWSSPNRAATPRRRRSRRTWISTLAKAGSAARAAAQPLKPTGADIALLVVWVIVLLVAIGATSMRLATGEGWLAKVTATVFGNEMPFDLVQDHDRSIDFGEVAPGLGSSLLLVFVPILAACGLGVGKRGWTIAAWVCLFAALPLVFLDLTNIAGPSVKDVGAALAIGGGWVVFVAGLGLGGAALVALGRGGWHAHRQREPTRDR